MLSDQINHILKGCDLKQRELAEILGVPLQRVKRLVGGEAQKLTQSELKALTVTLGISADWLISGEGSMLPVDGEALQADGVSERLRHAIKVTGLTQKDFAVAANVPFPSLKEYLSGKKRPGFNALAAIAKTSGVSADWLLSGETEVKDPSKLSPPDFHLLEQIIEGVEEFLEQRRKKLTPQKKAKVIALLYEHFYGEGEVDTAYVKSIVGVAA